MKYEEMSDGDSGESSSTPSPTSLGNSGLGEYASMLQGMGGGAGPGGKEMGSDNRDSGAGGLLRTRRGSSRLSVSSASGGLLGVGGASLSASSSGGVRQPGSLPPAPGSANGGGIARKSPKPGKQPARSQSAHLTDAERRRAFHLLDEFARSHYGNLHGAKAFVAKTLGVSGTTMTRVYKDWAEWVDRGRDGEARGPHDSAIASLVSSGTSSNGSTHDDRRASLGSSSLSKPNGYISSSTTTANGNGYYGSSSSSSAAQYGNANGGNNYYASSMLSQPPATSQPSWNQNGYSHATNGFSQTHSMPPPPQRQPPYSNGNTSKESPSMGSTSSHGGGHGNNGTSPLIREPSPNGGPAYEFASGPYGSPALSLADGRSSYQATPDTYASEAFPRLVSDSPVARPGPFPPIGVALNGMNYGGANGHANGIGNGFLANGTNGHHANGNGASAPHQPPNQPPYFPPTRSVPLPDASNSFPSSWQPESPQQPLPPPPQRPAYSNGYPYQQQPTLPQSFNPITAPPLAHRASFSDETLLPIPIPQRPSIAPVAEEVSDKDEYGPLLPPKDLVGDLKPLDVDEICHRGAFVNLLCQHLDDQPLGRVYAEYMTLLAKNRETPESPGGGFNPREMYHITNSPCFKDFVVDENEELTSENFAKLCPVVHGILQKISFTPGSLSQYATPNGLFTLLDIFPKMPLPNEPTSRFRVERCAPNVIRWHIASPHDPNMLVYKDCIRLIYGSFCIRMGELCGEDVKIRVGKRVAGTCNFSVEFRYPRAKFGSPTGALGLRDDLPAPPPDMMAGQELGSGIFGAFGLDLDEEGLVLGEGGI